MDNQLQVNNLLNELADIDISKELIASEDFGKKYEALVLMTKLAGDVKKKLDAKIKDALEEQYEETGVASVSNGQFNYTYVASTTSVTVDSAKLKKEFPDVYNKVLKTSTRASSIRVTEKTKTEDGADA